MNKKLALLLIPTLLFSVGCSNNQEPSSEASSTISVNEDIINEVNVLNSQHLTEVRRSYNIQKEKVTYYDLYQLCYYDETNGITSIQENITKYNDYSSEQQVTFSKTYTYYDGLYAYTLKDDKMYHKTSFKRENTFLTTGLNYAVIDQSFSITKKDDKNILTGVIKSSKATELFGKEKNDISDINFTSTTDAGQLLKIELTYTQAGFEIKETYDTGSFSKNLTLPTNVLSEK
jgi:hypothetical protein